MNKIICAVLISAVASFVWAEPLTLTWNGGSTGSLSIGPWSGGTEGHATPQNGDTLVFASGATVESDIGGLQVSALTFSSTAAVTLQGSQPVTVLCGGTVSSTKSGEAKISSPLVCGEAAGSAVALFAAANCRLVISGVISGEAPISVGSSKGTVNFTGDNTFTGKLTVTNGYFNAKGEHALGLGTTDAAVFKTGDGTTRAQIKLIGVTVPMSVEADGNNKATEATFDGGTIGDVIFLQPFRYANSPQVTFAGTTVFSNNFTCSGSFQAFVGPSARMEFWGETSQIAKNWTFVEGTMVVGGVLKLRDVVSDESLGLRFRKSGGKIITHIANAFPSSDANERWVAIRFQSGVANNVLDMAGNDQTFLRVVDSAKDATNGITSEDPAVLTLTQDTGASAATLYGTIGGAVSLKVAGPDPLYLNAANTSSGDLILTNRATVGFTSSGKWKGLRAVVAGASTLSVANANSLDAKAVVAIVDDGAGGKSKLQLDAPVRVRTLSVNGHELIEGTWGSTASGADNKDDDHFSGTQIVVIDAQLPTTTAVWDGGGTDTALSTDKNWVGDQAPNLQEGSLVATFAEGGSCATVDADVSVRGLVFAGASSVFALDGDAALNLGREGLTVAASHIVTNDVPVRLVADQQWSIAADASLSVVNPLASAGAWKLTKTGPGAMCLGCENSFAGDFLVTDGRVDVTASCNPFGAASETAVAEFVERTGSQSTLSQLNFLADCLIERPFRFRFYNGTLTDDLVFSAGHRVIFTQPVEFAKRTDGGSTQGYVRFDPAAEVVLSNGLKTVAVILDAPGNSAARLVVRGKPVSASGTVYLKNKMRLSLCESNNEFTSVTVNGAGVEIDLKASYALSNGCALAVKDEYIKWSGSIDLNGFDQRIGSFKTWPGDTATIKSSAPAMFCFSTPAGTSLTNASVKFVGAAGLGKYGSGTYAVDCAMSSAGDVEVSDGELAFASGGSWLNGTNVTVKGTGRLSLSHSKTFGRQATLRIDSQNGAIVSVGNGVSERMSALYLNGVLQPAGVYGGPDSAATYKLSCFASGETGTLTVGKQGLIIMLR